MSQYVN